MFYRYDFKGLLLRLKIEAKRQNIINKILWRSGLITEVEYYYRRSLYIDAVLWLDFFAEFLPYMIGKNTLPVDEPIQE